jgi:hypothetical protein
LLYSLFLFNYCALKINHENHKKYKKIKKIKKNKKYIARVEIGSII